PRRPDRRSAPARSPRATVQVRPRSAVSCEAESRPTPLPPVRRWRRRAVPCPHRCSATADFRRYEKAEGGRRAHGTVPRTRPRGPRAHPDAPFPWSLRTGRAGTEGPLLVDPIGGVPTSRGRRACRPTCRSARIAPAIRAGPTLPPVGEPSSSKDPSPTKVPSGETLFLQKPDNPRSERSCPTCFQALCSVSRNQACHTRAGKPIPVPSADVFGGPRPLLPFRTQEAPHARFRPVSFPHTKLVNRGRPSRPPGNT